MRAFWRREPAPRKCETCRSRDATFRSQISGRWLCDGCNPCYCNWCQGQAGIHGADAVALYRAEVDALSAKVKPVCPKCGTRECLEDPDSLHW